MPTSTPGPTLALEQKRSLYRDGYLVLKGAVSEELIEAARQRIRRAKKGENLFGEQEMTDLVNASSITPILTEAMGRFDPPIASQVGVLKAASRRTTSTTSAIATGTCPTTAPRPTWTA